MNEEGTGNIEYYKESKTIKKASESKTIIIDETLSSRVEDIKFDTSKYKKSGIKRKVVAHVSRRN